MNFGLLLEALGSLAADLPASLGSAADKSGSAVCIDLALGHASGFAIGHHASGIGLNAEFGGAADCAVNGIVGRIATHEG